MADPVHDAVEAADAVRIVSRLGRLFLANGADTGHALRHMEDVARRLGYASHILATYEAVLVTLERDGQFRTKLGRTIPSIGADMGRLMALWGVADRVGPDQAGVETTWNALDAVESLPKYPAAVVSLGLAVTAASLARLFGAGWSVVAASFVAGLLGTILRLRLGRTGLNGVAVAALIAFVSGLCGALAMMLAPASSPVLCLTAAGMILVPGVPLINAVRDLVGGHVSNALCRLAVGMVTVIAIGLALLAAAGVTGTTLPVDAPPAALALWEDVVFSGLAAVGYALLFNVPGRLVWVCVVCGMASHGLRSGLEGHGLDIATASFFGAVVAGLIARVAARRVHAPAVAFAFAGTVAMVPGSYGFRAAVGALHVMNDGAGTSPALLASTVSLFITTAVTTVAIAAGLCIALAERRRPSPSLPSRPSP